MQLSTRQTGIAAVLVLLMAATRMHHFGDATHLPDASLAVFVLAGFFITNPLFFVGLLLEAGLLDYLATSQFAVSDWCLTPAYGFLIPTYGALWLAGRYAQNHHQDNLRGLLQFSGISVIAISIAFLISNLSFFWLSGRYDTMSLLEYVGHTAKYYPQYMAGGIMYLVCAVIVYSAAVVRTPVTSKN